MSNFRKYDRELARAVASAVQADYLALPTLRRQVEGGRIGAAGLRNMMLRDLEYSITPGAKHYPMFPSLVRVLRTQMNVEEAKLRGGVAQWAELATAIAGAAGGIINTRTAADANKELAKLDLQKQQLALQAAQLQANTAKLQLAAAQGYTTAPDGSIIPGGGTPGWVTPVAIGGGVAALGLFAYLMTRRRGR